MLVAPRDLPALSDARAHPSIVEEIAARGRADFYFFCKAILRYIDMNVETHKKWCEFVKADTWKRKMGFQPRFHLKTTIGSIADPIHRIVNDPTFSTLILFENAQKAERDIISPIKDHFRGNPMFRACYPDIIPTSFSDPDLIWAADAANIRRPPGFSGPVAFQVMGVKSDPTGLHRRLIIFDDAFAKEASESPAIAEKIITLFSNAGALLIDPKRDFIHVWGTRWHMYDLAEHIMRKIGGVILNQEGDKIQAVTAKKPRYLIWIRSYLNTDNSTIWPERFDHDAAEAMEQETGPYQFSLQFKNNPIDPANISIDPQNLRYWDPAPGGMFTLYDPITNKHSAPIDPEDCDRIGILDPAISLKDSASNTAIVILFMTPGGEVVVREAWAKRCKKTTRDPDNPGWLDQMYIFQKQYNLREFGIESIAFQATIGRDDIWERNFREPFPISVGEIMVKDGMHPVKKDNRIRFFLQQVTTTRRLYLGRDQPLMITEVAQHPSCRTKDLADALARGIPRLVRPLTPDEKRVQEREEWESEAGLGIETGYGLTW